MKQTWCALKLCLLKGSMIGTLDHCCSELMQGKMCVCVCVCLCVCTLWEDDNDITVEVTIVTCIAYGSQAVTSHIAGCALPLQMEVTASG